MGECPEPTPGGSRPKGGLTWFDGIEFTGELAKIKAPALVIWGELDDVTPLQHSQQIADGIAGARLETIPDAAHISNVDQPEAFNRILAGFLDEQPR